MIERKIKAALQVDTADVRLPNDLSERIKREAAKPQQQPWWASWTKRKRLQVAAAALLVLPLAGFTAKQIWYDVPTPPAEGVKERPRKEISVSDLTTIVDFQIKLPSHLPDGMPLLGSYLAGGSTEDQATLRVVELHYGQPGTGAILVMQWEGEQSTPYPPAHPYAEALDSKPWYKTLKTTPVDINGVQGHAVLHLLSGVNYNAVYWHQEGVNYSISAPPDVASSDELLRVAGSLR